jgi:hypothetical protein
LPRVVMHKEQTLYSVKILDIWRVHDLYLKMDGGNKIVEVK